MGAKPHRSSPGINHLPFPACCSFCHHAGVGYGTAVSFSLGQLLPFHQHLTSSLRGTQPKNMGLSCASPGRRDRDTWAAVRHLGGYSASSSHIGFNFLPRLETWWRSRVLPSSQASWHWASLTSSLPFPGLIESPSHPQRLQRTSVRQLLHDKFPCWWPESA